MQANPVTNLLNGLLNDTVTVHNEARRGGGARRTSTPRRPSATTSSTSSRQSSTMNRNTAQTQKQDANFTQRSQQSAPNNAAAGNTAANPAAANPAMARGGMGMGSTFLTSLAGAGAGVLLANMLLSPAAAAEQGTEVATPDMLSDDQINECLTQIDADIKSTQESLQTASAEEKPALSEQLSKMNELKITLLQEQLNRMKNS